jgi:hypothetical protein
MNVDGAVDAARLALANGCEPHELADRIYANWYAAPVAPLAAPADLPDDLAAMFRAAHAGSDRWDGGWLVELAASGGGVAVARGTERRVLDRCDYLDPARPGIVAGPGATVLAPARRDFLDAAAGWWYTHHEDWTLDAPDARLVRAYWNVGPGAAALLVRHVSSHLLESGVPWMLKCAVHRESYTRADVAILFLPSDELELLQSVVDDVREAIAPVLRVGTPPLTLRAGRGVSVADDPGTGESFGEHRCRLIAEGILAAPSPERQRAAIAERFLEEGVPPDRPYVAAAARSLPWE